MFAKKENRKIILTFSLVMLMYGLVLSLEQLILDDVQELYNANAQIMGFAVSIKSIVMFIVPILMGLVADKKGKKFVLIIFLGVNVFACCIIGASNTLSLYILGTAILGAGCSTCESMSVSCFPDIDMENGAQIGNFVQTIFACGAGTMPIVISLLMQKGIVSWRAGYLFAAAMYIFLVLRFSKISFPKPQLEVNNKEAEQTNNGKKITLKQILTLLFIVLFAIMVVYLILENSFAYFIDSLTSAKNIGNAGAYALAFYWYGMAISRLFIATRKEVKEIKVIRICYIFSAIFIALVTVVNSPVLSVVLCLLAGIAFGPIWPTLVAYAGRKYKGAASLVSIIVAGGGLGGIIGPAITGTLAENVSFVAAFAVLTVFAICGALLTLAVKKEEQ